MVFTVRRGPALGVWRFEADVPDAGTALRILERWAREFPHDFAEVEGIAGVFASHDPATNTVVPRRSRREADRLYSRRGALPVPRTGKHPDRR